MFVLARVLQLRGSAARALGTLGPPWGPGGPWVPGEPKGPFGTQGEVPVGSFFNASSGKDEAKLVNYQESHTFLVKAV